MCPSGTTVIGGGATVLTHLSGDVDDSYPDGTTGLDAAISTTSTTCGSRWHSTAICAPAAATTGSADQTEARPPVDPVKT